jgi:hypothetical protein
MSCPPAGRLVLLLSAVILAACTEMPTAPPAAPDKAGDVAPPSQAQHDACSALATLDADIVDWFPPHRQPRAQTLATWLRNSCQPGGMGGPSGSALQMLMHMEVTFNDGDGDDGAAGVRLVRSMIACMYSFCSIDALPDQSLDTNRLLQALTHDAGLFAVRSGNSAVTAVARAEAPMNGNSALWGTESSIPWRQAVPGSPKVVVIYGFPLGLEPEYDLNIWPRNGPFTDTDIVHVSVCFAADYEAPGEPDGVSRMLRNASLLGLWQPGFCPGDVQAQSAGSMFGIMSGHGVRNVGGSASDFSIFRPVAADTSASLTILLGPGVGFIPADFNGTVKVLAATKWGTPIASVAVDLTLRQANQPPQDAILWASGYTGDDGTVTFEELTIGTPGTYVVCAVGALPGYDLAPTCSAPFEVGGS